jgi:ferric-dicitrate binding protein FerR (iron transport regulator)
MRLGQILQKCACGLLILVLFALPPAIAQEVHEIGRLERVRKEVSALPPAGDAARELKAGASVFQNETVRTGKDARAELRLPDATRLVMGEKAEVLLDTFIYDREGGAVINLATGALRFISGKTGHPGKLAIKTPVATIGVRGTDFWAGPIDGVFGVLLLSGEVEVSNSGGSVTLDSPGVGTLISGEDIVPGNAAPWPDDRRARALSKTDF